MKKSINIYVEMGPDNNIRTFDGVKPKRPRRYGLVAKDHFANRGTKKFALGRSRITVSVWR